MPTEAGQIGNRFHPPNEVGLQTREMIEDCLGVAERTSTTLAAREKSAPFCTLTHRRCFIGKYATRNPSIKNSRMSTKHPFRQSQVARARALKGGLLFGSTASADQSSSLLGFWSLPAAVNRKRQSRKQIDFVAASKISDGLASPSGKRIRQNTIEVQL